MKVIIHKNFLPLLCLILLTLAAYYPATQAEFVWDDHHFFLNDPLMTAPDGLWRIWFDPDKRWNYWPITRSAFWVQQQLWGSYPQGYHLVNITVHLLNAIILWLALKQFRIRGAWIIGALFAIHPMHVASVAWATELKNTLSGFFYLLSIWSFINFDHNKSWRWYGIAIGMFICALLSKSATIMLPVLLIIYRVWFGRKWGKINFLSVIPFFLLSLGSAYVTIWFETRYIGTQTGGLSLNLIERIIVAGHIPFFYLGKFLFPYPLMAVYPKWEITMQQFSLYLPSIFWGIASIITLWKYQSWGKSFFLSLSAFIISLFPVLGLLNIAGFTITFVWMHLTYLPSIPILILLGQGGVRISDYCYQTKLIGRKIIPAMAGIIFFVILGTLTWKHALTYKDEETMWKNALKKNPDNWRVHQGLGSVYGKKGTYPLAIQHLNIALQMNPRVPDTHFNRGNVYEKLEQYNQAMRDYNNAILLQPKDGDYYHNRGVVYSKLQQYGKALHDFDKAIEIDSNNGGYYNNRGIAHEKLQQFKNAIQDYKKAIEMNPKNAEYYNNIGTTHGKLQQFEKALQYHNQALVLNPDKAEYYNNRGFDYESLQQHEEAIENYTNAILLDPDKAEYFHNRGLVYKEIRNYEKALQDYNKALELNKKYVEAYKNRGVLYSRLQQYQQALQDYNNVLKLDPQNFAAYYNRGMTYAQLRQFDSAIQDFNQLLKMNPKFVEGYNSRGFFYKMRGDLTKACSDWKHACRQGNCKMHAQAQKKQDCP
ncbi:MAG: tetratricopeptide repeat protein [SAR324 cluster bacterium]|nr:tetratricopeptide repeat protein [SAR324 cluster bacterium]